MMNWLGLFPYLRFTRVLSFMRLKKTIMSSVDYVVNALGFYLVFAIVLLIVIPLGKIAEQNTTAAAIYLIITLLASSFMAGKLSKSLNAYLLHFNFKIRAILSVQIIPLIICAFYLLFSVVLD